MTKNKYKNDEMIVARLAENIGMFVVAIATVINMAELANHEGRHLMGVLQPAYALQSAASRSTDIGGQGTELRRSGREEIRHTSATYGSFVRSQPTAGSI